MNTKAIASLLIAFCLTLSAFTQTRTLDYHRPTAVDDRDIAISRAEIPGEHVLIVPERQRQRSVDRRPRSSDERIDLAALQAARWAAEELARGYGYREYYRLGFFQGLQATVETGAHTALDYREGERAGRRDLDARREGRTTGRELARQMARKEAIEEVTRRFRDLSRNPSRHLPDNTPSVPGFDVENTFEAPALADVFAEMPLVRFASWRARETRFFENWRPDPWRLYQAGHHNKVFEDRWKKPSYAFDFWREDRQRRAVYDRLDQDGRARFRGTFNEAYRDELALRYAEILAPAHTLGWQDGQTYGFYIAREWHWRRGYFDGASENFEDAARRAYRSEYPETYRDTFDREYRQWQESSVLEITEIWVEDDNRDGVFEPGEIIEIDFRLANFGGRGTTVPVSVEGAGLGIFRARKLTVEPRSELEPDMRLRTALTGGIAPKRDHAFVLRVGEAQLPFTLHITHPLLFERPRIVERDNVNGYARLLVRVSNISNRPINGARVFSGLERAELGTIEAGGAWEKTFTLEGMQPLEMIAGATSLDLEIATDTQKWDHIEFTLPEMATDLRSDDLDAVLIELAHQYTPSRTDLELAYRLLVRRLSADWDAAIKAKGNPYKRDRKKGTGETALARLLLAYKAERDGFANDEVFGNLRPMLLNMAKDLPGWHPFLRKQFRRLAEQFG